MNRHNLLARRLLISFLLCLPIAIVVPLLAGAHQPPNEETALVVLSSDSDAVLVQLEVPYYALRRSVTGTEPSLSIQAPGLSGSTATPGQPRLPYHSTLIAVPPEAQVAVQVFHVESEHAALALPLETVSPPGQAIPFDRQADATGVPSTAAGSGDRYPGDLAVVGAPQYFRDQRLVRLDLYPFQVDPDLGELIIVRRMVVRLEFSAGKANSSERVAELNDSTERALQDTVLNYEQGRLWREYPASMPVPQASLPLGLPVYKIEVDRDAIYRVTYHDLVAAGMDVTNTIPLSLSLSSGGNPVAIDWQGDDDRLFEPDEAFVFYGQKFHSTVWEEQYTDVNAYWLQTTIQPGLRMATVTGARSGAPALDSYRASVRVEKDALFTHLHTTALGEIDTWYAQKNGGNTIVTLPVTLTALAPGSFTATVSLEQFSDCRYTGAAEEHKVEVRLNDVHIDTQVWESRGGIDNCSVHLLSGPIEQSRLLEGDGNRLTWIVSSTHPYGEWLNWWEVSYQRALQADDDQLTFGLDEAGEWVYTVTGFSTSSVGVWDLSDPLAPTRVSAPQIHGDGPYSVTFQLNRPSPGMAAAVGAGSLATPRRVSRYEPPLLEPPAGADWIAITHRDFITEVERLAEYRADQGLRTWVADIDDVFNQYGAGVSRPAAVRDYLVRALSWEAPPPSFVVLVGDGNWNYKSVPDCYPYCDPDPIYVPPYMGVVDPYQGQVPADNLYATLVSTDAIPDIALGRLPVRSITETAQVVDKIIQHESQLVRPEEWQFDLTFLADERDPSAGDFPLQSDLVVEQVPPYLSPNRIYHMTEGYTSTTATRDAVVQAVNRGTTFLNYRGHGGVLLWGDGFFSIGYLSLLTNTQRLPVIFSFDCLDTYFAIPSLQSLGESTIRYELGGSVAHWGSSGLGISSDHLILNQALMSAIFDRGLGRLGDAILAAKLAFAATGWQMHNLHTFTLLGDPAMPLMASDLQIDLSPLDREPRRPGDSLTDLIRVTNEGLLWSTGTVISDLVPAELTLETTEWSGLSITSTAGISYSWAVAPVTPLQSGVITVSSRIDPQSAITSPLTLTRTAIVAATGLDWNPTNNASTIWTLVLNDADVYLPVIVRGQ